MHRSVRSLSRGLALIRDLNVTGPSSAQQLAARTGLNRTTCYRLLQTLQQNEDFIGELIEIRQAEKALEVIRSAAIEARGERPFLHAWRGNRAAIGLYESLG